VSVYSPLKRCFICERLSLITLGRNINVNLKEMNANDLQFVAGSKVVVIALVDSLRSVRS